jgi:hypothetical protein
METPCAFEGGIFDDFGVGGFLYLDCLVKESKLTHERKKKNKLLTQYTAQISSE